MSMITISDSATTCAAKIGKIRLPEWNGLTTLTLFPQKWSVREGWAMTPIERESCNRQAMFW